MSLLVNKKHVKLFAIACAQNRAHFRGKKVRVSAEFYAKCDAALKQLIATDVASRPSKGITL